MSSVIIAGDTSGTVTLQAPAIAGSTVLTLPTTSGTIVTTAGGSTVPFALGSAASPSITFTGDTNTGIFSPGADTIAFSEGGVESMRIDSSGNVGIGTSSPAVRLQVVGNISLGSANNLSWGGAYGAGISTLTADGTNGFQFYPAGSTSGETMRINASGNVGIGTSSPQARLDVRTTGAAANLIVSSDISTSALASRISLGNSTGANRFTMGVLGTAGELAYIGPEGNFPFTFQTNGTERMRITSGGNLLVGQTTASNANFLLNCVGGGLLTTRVNIGDNGGIVDGSTLYLASDSVNSATWSPSNANYRFGANRGGCVVAINPGGYTYEGGSGTGTRTFAVNSNGNVQNSNNSYGSLSDAKLKENVVDASPKLDDLMKVQIRNFNLIADEAKTKQIGVVAQELEQVFPGMIEEHIDYTYEDYVNEYGCNDKKAVPTGTVTKEVKYSVFVPMLIKALQEQQAIITAMEARLTALENK